MPIVYQEDLAILEGRCTIEETDNLLVWAKQHPKGRVDLEKCKHLHTAVLQTLVSARPKIVKNPDDLFLNQWVVPLLTGDSPPTPHAAFVKRES